ncbi:hypothetical protein Y032_0143g2421 [Ancylostoma ceylanicum]|uniref:Uncharacterized protein n=1 Tax=Ancylostoma ceylanicum TaxID=53326 RepID=A0A016T392_9BILA|nr:hypothetical protein Y032_0143g2421 [Ancylostoma ceylanicum]
MEKNDLLSRELHNLLFREDSCSSGAVAARAFRGCGRATAIDAHCNIVCVGGFFVFIMAAASYFFLLDEARFRRFAPISRGLLRDSSTSRVELAQVYMTMMAFCLVHAAAFFMIAVFSYKLRTTHS